MRAAQIAPAAKGLGAAEKQARELAKGRHPESSCRTRHSSRRIDSTPGTWCVQHRLPLPQGLGAAEKQARELANADVRAGGAGSDGQYSKLEPATPMTSLPETSRPRWANNAPGEQRSCADSRKHGGRAGHQGMEPSITFVHRRDGVPVPRCRRQRPDSESRLSPVACRLSRRTSRAR